jgi:hypothetical protein
MYYTVVDINVNDTDNRFKPQVQPLIVNKFETLKSIQYKLTGTERK